MTKAQFSKRILIFELVGFCIVLIFLWLDELLDLPHYLFGSPATPINYAESIFETVGLLLLGTLAIFSTSILLRRIKHLEGVLPVCSFCKKIRLGDSWIAIDNYLRDHSDADLSHTICPECAAEHFGDILDTQEKDL